MPKRETRTLSFTPEHAALVRACVCSGLYQSASEVVRAALRLLEDQEAKREAELDRLRALVERGVGQLDRGEVVAAEDVLRRLDQKHARLKTDTSRDE
jgi:antitoxin ParD1/3/4